MIHSLSGGVIAENEIYTFAKVDIAGTPRWYLSPTSKIKAGDRVEAPLNGKLVTGVVLRTEDCSRQTAPVPMNRVQRIWKILSES